MTSWGVWRHGRAMLWIAAGVVAFGFLVALEIAARRYGEPGPITNQVQALLLAPKPGPLYGGLVLMMVVLTWRQRFIAAGAAIGVDAALLPVRWAAGAEMSDGQFFGTGALWVMLGFAVVAVTRRTGGERVLLLKGVGLGLLLVAARKTGDTWLLITSKTRPTVLDQYVAMADHALGNPSWLAGRLVEATNPVSSHVLQLVYGQLAVAAVVVAFYQLRNVVAERRFPRHHLVRTFLVIGLLGPGIYMLFPVVGPVFAYGPGASGTGGVEWAAANLWPHTPLPITATSMSTTRSSTSSRQPSGRPSGVIPPYSMPVSPVAVSIEAKEALRAPSRRRTTPFTSTRVVDSTTHAASVDSPPRLPETTTQFADHSSRSFP